MFDVVFIICVCVIDILFLGWVYFTCDTRPTDEIHPETITNPIYTPQHRAEI